MEYSIKSMLYGVYNKVHAYMEYSIKSMLYGVLNKVHARWSIQ